MRKIILLISIILFSTNALADKMTKSGFLSDKVSYSKEQKIDNPQNKILLIYNHGQSSHDGPSNDCAWKGGMKNISSLVGAKIKDKEIVVYLFCTGKLKGDDYKRLWNKKKFKEPYKGKPKLEKRLDSNLKLIEDFAAQGFKKNQIFLTGRSCGGWMTMMLLSRYQDIVAGGISFVPECYGKLTKMYKVKKIGVDEALKNFKEKDGSGPANMRQKQIDEIKKSKNLPVLVFTHPKDPFGGLISDWVEEIPGVERIVISQDNKVNGKSCKVWGESIKNYHDMDRATCFKEFNPKILDFIASKIN
jgi:dienelactone hydrolase